MGVTICHDCQENVEACKCGPPPEERAEARQLGELETILVIGAGVVAALQTLNSAIPDPPAVVRAPPGQRFKNRKCAGCGEDGPKVKAKGVYYCDPCGKKAGL